MVCGVRNALFYASPFWPTSGMLLKNRHKVRWGSQSERLHFQKGRIQI
nr:MAG TPA: hypothetical protein [Caudoviricetes sp.]